VLFLLFFILCCYCRQESEADKAEVARLEAAMCQTIPLSSLPERRTWRDKRLAALAKLKRELDKAE
jgi:hypothetical protein